MSATALISTSRFSNPSAQGIFLHGIVPSAKPAVRTTLPTVEERVDSAAGFEKPIVPTMSLFQRVTQPKVLIGVGVALTTIGVIGAAYAFPVATAAHAVTIGQAARSTLIHTHAFLQPGLAANALLLDMALKTTGIAASIAMPVVSPALSMAIVGVLGGIAAIYVANKVWTASKVVICSAASFALNTLDKALCQSGPGWLLKTVVILPVYSAFSAVFGSSAQAPVSQSEPSEKQQTVANPEKAQEIREDKAQELSPPVTMRDNPGMSKPAAAAAAVLTLGLMGALFYQSGMNLSDFAPIESV